MSLLLSISLLITIKPVTITSQRTCDCTTSCNAGCICNTNLECDFINIYCVDGTDCTVTCSNYEACMGAKVYCPSGYDCTISCMSSSPDVTDHCYGMTVYAVNSTTLTFQGCTGKYSCIDMTVYCPPNVNGDKKCIMVGDTDGFGGDDTSNDPSGVPAINGFSFYAINGWLDIDTSGYTGNYMSEYHIGSMSCGDNGYPHKCDSLLSAQWLCSPLDHICNNISTPAPSTSNPTTTKQPTTLTPTTSAPTTSIPTTAIPNTTIPTTSSPTTSSSIPITASPIPTTLSPIPSTSNPTTTKPTTSVPTTSIPTTAIPTTSVPTTSIPTTSANPTTNIPSTSFPTTSIPTTSNPSYTPTNRPSPSGSYIPTVSPVKSGKINEQSTTVHSQDTKQPLNESSADSYYILYVFLGVVIVFMIIACLSVFIWKRKKFGKQREVNISNIIDNNNVSNNEYIDAYDPVWDKSPISANNKKIENMGEIQLTAACYKEGKDVNNDPDNNDIEEMYTNVITDDGNNVTNDEHNMDKNNVMYNMEDMDDNNDNDDMYGNIPTNTATIVDIVTNGNI